MKMDLQTLSKSSFQKKVLVFFCLFIIFMALLSQYLGNIKTPKFTLPKPSLRNMTTAVVSQTYPSQEKLLKEADDFCKLQPSNPPDSLEEQHILDSIAWPPTSSHVGVKSTDARNSSFSVYRRTKGQQWHVGDQLTVAITMRDFLGQPKTTGGDVLVARLYNPALQAGVAGAVRDHENGSYTATFPLLWTGTVIIQVILLHPSEAVTVLKRLNKEIPDRVHFKSIFRQNSKTETMRCNVCLRPTNLPLCDFTDVRTGEPWFCFKPKTMGCETRITHSMGGYTRGRLYRNPVERNLFKNGVNMKANVPSKDPPIVNVLPQSPGSSEVNQTVLGHSGFYYRGEWRALDGTTVQHFKDSAAMSRCLRGKKIYIYGDSTVRQWYEYLVAKLPGLVNFDLHTPPRSGPYMATDNKNNIILNYHTHGPPIRSRPISVSKSRLVANELHTIEGGADTVVILGIWAHFGSFPDELFLRRLQRIRNSVVQLLRRSPDTLVIIRTGNIKDLSLSKAVYNSDWTTMQHNKILRALFRGVEVQWLDAWEMTLAHTARFLLHPLPPIIKNMVDVILSYICPLK